MREPTRPNIQPGMLVNNDPQLLVIGSPASETAAEQAARTGPVSCRGTAPRFSFMTPPFLTCEGTTIENRTHSWRSANTVRLRRCLLVPGSPSKRETSTQLRCAKPSPMRPYSDFAVGRKQYLRCCQPNLITAKQTSTRAAGQPLPHFPTRHHHHSKLRADALRAVYFYPRESLGQSFVSSCTGRTNISQTAPKTTSKTSIPGLARTHQPEAQPFNSHGKTASAELWPLTPRAAACTD